MGADPRILATWHNDADLAEACRRRADDLSMSYEEIDRIANLASGHTSKVLSVPQQQGFGPVSRFTIPWALQMKFGLVEAPEYTRQYVRRVTRAVRRGKRHWRTAKTLSMIENLARKNGQRGAEVRMQKTTPKTRKRVARTAAKARWRKARLAMKANAELMKQVQI